MLLAVSIDRLLSVIIPLRHGGWGRTYAIALISTAYLPLMFFSPYLAFRAWSYHPGVKILSAICIGNDMKPQLLLYRFIKSLNVMAGFLSVIIYVIIAVKVRLKNKGKLFKKRQQDKAIRHELVQQRRLTVSIAISTTSIMIFFILPVCINWTLFALGVSKNLPIIIGPVAIILRKLSFVIDFFVYTTRHKHVKLGVKYLLKCKELTEVVLMIINK